MKNQKYINWLIKELAPLEELGLLKEGQAQAIEEYYKQNFPQTRTNWLLIVFAIFGALCIGGGLLSIIAFNWHKLGQIPKTILAFLPIILAQVLAYFVCHKKMQSIAWREGISIFYGLCLASSLALVGQIYHFLTDYEQFCLIWVILSLPLIYFFNSTSLTILLSLFILPLKAFWLIILALVFFIYKVMQNKYNASAYILSIIFALLLPIKLGLDISGNFLILFNLIYAIYAVFLFVIGTFYFKQNDNHPLRIIGFLGLCLLAYLHTFSFFGLFSHSEIIHWDQLPFYVYLIYLIFMSIILYFIPKTKTLFISEWALIIYPVCALINLLAIIFKASYGLQEIIFYLYNLYFIFLAISLIIRGNNYKIFKIAGAGSFLLAIYTAGKFLSIQSNLIIKGLILIVIGCLFLAFNYSLKKRLEKGN